MGAFRGDKSLDPGDFAMGGAIQGCSKCCCCPVTERLGKLRGNGAMDGVGGGYYQPARVLRTEYYMLVCTM